VPDIHIRSLDGQQFGGYIAKPVSGRGPGMVVIQEIFGVNEGMRQICDAYAAAGYIAICPDLFWRQQPGVQLTDKTEAEWARAFELYNGFDVEAGIRDLLSTLAHFRKMPECNGKVGAIGYCLGGKLAYYMATRSDIDAAVSYYGVGIETALDEISDIRMPYMMHIAEGDKFVPPAAQQQILAAIKRNKAITAHVYPNVDHAFARPDGQHYQAAAATLANNRTAEFFKTLLMA
jgi:carboxymethylenebutenolidase